MDFDKDAAGNTIQAGQVIDDEYAAWGITINAENANSYHPDKAITFDSSNPTGGDYDLRTGTGAYGFENNSSDPSLNNVLIIAENDTDSNGDGFVDNPDDEGYGGYIQFVSSSVLNEGGTITLLDMEESLNTIQFFLAGVELTTQELSIPALGDNSLQTISFGSFDYDKIQVNFVYSSGAITALTLADSSVVPEPSTFLMLVSFLLFVQVYKKRKKERLFNE